MARRKVGASEFINVVLIVAGVIKGLVEALTDSSTVNPVIHIEHIVHSTVFRRKIARFIDDNLFDLDDTKLEGVYTLWTEEWIPAQGVADWCQQHGYRSASSEEIRWVAMRHSNNAYCKYLQVADDDGKNKYYRLDWNGENPEPLEESSIVKGEVIVVTRTQ